MDHGHRFIDLTGKRFGRLVALRRVSQKGERVRWSCKCDCGNKTTVYATYLQTGDTRSCGCLKKELENKHLRDEYDSKKVDGVAMQLFKGKEPRKDSSTGYRGVSRYYTRVSKQERFRAYITVKGKIYKKAGFLTAEDAYYNGRLKLEKKHLPERTSKNDRN